MFRGPVKRFPAAEQTAFRRPEVKQHCALIDSVCPRLTISISNVKTTPPALGRGRRGKQTSTALKHTAGRGTRNANFADSNKCSVPAICCQGGSHTLNR